MGQTAIGTTVASGSVGSEDDVGSDLIKGLQDGGVVSVAFASMGTGPSAIVRGGRLRVTVGTGAPAIAANNIQVTCRRPPRKVFVASDNAGPGYHVASISGSVVNIGTKVAPVASQVHNVDLIILY